MTYVFKIETYGDGSFKTFFNDGKVDRELTKEYEISEKRVLELLNSQNNRIESTISNPFITYLKINSGIVWVCGVPHYIP